MPKRAKSAAKAKGKASRARMMTQRPAKGRRIKGKRAAGKLMRRPPARDALADFVEAAARALDLPLDPAWKGAVKANLEVTLALAAAFADFPLPDDAEPAPVFTA
jgi:hypothetical protein